MLGFSSIINNSSASPALSPPLPIITASSNFSTCPILTLLCHDNSWMTSLGVHLSLTSLPFNHTLTNSHLHSGDHLITWHLSFLPASQLWSIFLYFISTEMDLAFAMDYSLTGLLGCDVDICFSTALCVWSIPDSSKPPPPFSWISSFTYSLLWIWLFLCLSFLIFLRLSKICHFFSHHSQLFFPVLSSLAPTPFRALFPIIFLTLSFLFSCFLAPTGSTPSKASLSTFQTLLRLPFSASVILRLLMLPCFLPCRFSATDKLLWRADLCSSLLSLTRCSILSFLTLGRMVPLPSVLPSSSPSLEKRMVAWSVYHGKLKKKSSGTHKNCEVKLV